MKDRFIKLPCYTTTDGMVFFSDIFINPFQIESYYEVEISYKDESGIPVSKQGVKIATKSGLDHDIDLPIKEFENILG